MRESESPCNKSAKKNLNQQFERKEKKIFNYKVYFTFIKEKKKMQQGKKVKFFLNENSSMTLKKIRRNHQTQKIVK